MKFSYQVTPLSCSKCLESITSRALRAPRYSMKPVDPDENTASITFCMDYGKPSELDSASLAKQTPEKAQEQGWHTWTSPQLYPLLHSHTDHK